MRGRLRIRVEHSFQPDPEAVRKAIAALVRLSDERRASQDPDVASSSESA